MSGLSYEQVARFAQQGGTLYFVVIFLAGVVYALWPKNRQAFRDMAHLPLRED
ncbi:MAG: cbb3-type cytochrome c oxidase subunit 3, partial [Phenylobacterium sp.]|nr:cbb3-type cytochrome c oxidase subunit 3 [Phenylobacterium sp.]